MTPPPTAEPSRYATIARQLAVQALSIAVDAAPHRAREGELRWPLANALPAARVLVEGGLGSVSANALAEAAEQLVQTVKSPAGNVTDGFGHTRPVYAWFAVHLLGTAGRIAKDGGTLQATHDAATALIERVSTVSAEEDSRLAYWHRLVAWQQSLAIPGEALGGRGFCRAADGNTIAAGQEPLPPAEARPAPLTPLGLNDLIDSWTYYELVGLHGLYLANLLEPDEARAAHVRNATAYHLAHTQPDYTTYQPWGLAAFASDMATAIFAEQQLHDVATHLSIEGPGGAVMPALLLADSAAAMSGTLSEVWRSTST